MSNDEQSKSTSSKHKHQAHELPNATPIHDISVPESQVEAIDQAGIDLHNAVHHNNISRIRSLLSLPTTDVNVIDENGETALMIAVHTRNQKTTVVPMMLDDVNTSEVRMIPSADASMRNSEDIKMDMIKALSTHHRARLNQTNQSGDTVLTIAARAGDWDVIQTLLEASENKNQPVDLNHLDSHGKTALAIAVERQRSAVIHQLLNAKSKMGIATTHGINMKALYRYLDTCIITVRNSDYGQPGAPKQFSHAEIGTQLINRHLYRTHQATIYWSLAGSVFGAISYSMSKSSIGRFWASLITMLSVGTLINCHRRQGMIAHIDDIHFIDRVVLSTGLMSRRAKHQTHNSNANGLHENIHNEQRSDSPRVSSGT